MVKEHYQNVDPPPLPPPPHPSSKKKKKGGERELQVGKRLFGVHLVILRFKSQFSKSSNLQHF